MSTHMNTHMNTHTHARARAHTHTHTQVWRNNLCATLRCLCGELSADVGACDTEGRTALHAAAALGRSRTIACMRACMHASMHTHTPTTGRVEALQVLLQHGADPNARSKDGSTPVMAAARGVYVQAYTHARSTYARTCLHVPVVINVRACMQT